MLITCEEHLNHMWFKINIYLHVNHMLAHVNHYLITCETCGYV